ncbi:unnamed protein product [Acanthoscelides obtectus]|uniref:Uncharacterized protein n=1 Tax=Acanthoscelides obtectus TaxID=200917 RepID=A0A9P0NY40_ACAOB|nr:unnamed protein product [Acanthoscelides obtectus]CAK1668143.1 hypothetical protein AOBTE_LOCUS26256 [Acanthoscelides obtectus]
MLIKLYSALYRAISIPLLRRVTRKCPRTALAGSRLGAMLRFYY